jgi:antitoxin component YwqK of YwqJK toxin-antitoxin module
MRRLALLIAAGIVALSCGPGEVSISQIEEREGLIYQIGKSHPFSGRVVGYIAKQNVRISAEYRNGVKHGLFQEWYPNGTLKSSLVYEEGEKEGEAVSYYQDGQIKSLRHYTGGLLEGESEEFFPDGALRETSFYKEGALEGANTVYYENGSRRSTGWHSQGYADSLWTFWYPDGQVFAEGEYEKNTRTGEWKIFYPDGKLCLEMHYERVLNPGQDWYEPAGSWIYGNREGKRVEIHEKMDCYEIEDYIFLEGGIGSLDREEFFKYIRYLDNYLEE